VTPVPVNFLSSSEDTVLIDAGAPASALYYIVTAYDVHANQSAPSNEASVSATTNVGDTPPITALTVLQNHPNPFAGTTEMAIGLPAASSVEIEVYDVAGRKVRTQSIATRSAGWRKVAFDGRDDGGRLLPSGVYFYRVRANGETVSRKMVIAR
jgi:flagellar hook assembly protein FlgD